MVTPYVRKAIFTSSNSVISFVFILIYSIMYFKISPLSYSTLLSLRISFLRIFLVAPLLTREMLWGRGVESSFVFGAKPSHFVNLYRWWRPSPASQESRKWTRHLFLRPACFIIHVTLPPPPPKWLQKLIFFPFTWMHFLALSYAPLLSPDCLVPSSFFHYPESLLL